MTKLVFNLSGVDRGFVRKVGATVLSQIFVMSLSLLTGAVTARWLGPAGKGQLSLALMLPGILGLMVGLGLSSANVYFSGSRRLEHSDLAGNAVVMACLGCGVASCAVSFGVSEGWLSRIVPGVAVGSVLLGMAALPLILLSGGLSAILLGMQRVEALGVLNAIQAAVAAVALLILVPGMKCGIEGAILSAIIGSGVLLVGIARCLRREGVELRPRWRPEVMKATVSFGLRGYVANLLQFFNYRLDTLIVNGFIGPAGVGVYGVAVALAEMLWHLPNSVAFVIFPKAANTDAGTMNQFTPRVFWWVLGTSTVGAIALTLSGRQIIHFIMSDAFSAAYVPLLILLPGVALLGAGKVLTNDIAGRGFPQYNAITSGVSLAVTIVLDLALIPRFGVPGAALASSGAYVVTFAMSAGFYVMVSKRTRIGYTPAGAVGLAEGETSTSPMGKR